MGAPSAGNDGGGQTTGFRLDRWHIFAITLISYSGLGIGDSFGLYSATVKETFSLTQGQLDSIGMAGYWPNLLGAAIIPGLVGDRFGGGAAMLGAGLLIALGLMLFWATLVGALPVWSAIGPVWQLSIFEAIRAFGNQWPSTGALPTNLKNFGKHSSVSIRMFAILKCLGSVGGGVSSLCYIAFLAPNQSNFVLFAAVAVCGLCMLSVPFLLDRRHGETNEEVDAARFNHTLALLLVLIPVIAASAYVVENEPISRATGQAITLGVVVLWIVAALSPLWPGVRWRNGKLQRNPSAREANRLAKTNVAVQDTSPLLAAEEREQLRHHNPHIGEDRTVWQVLRTLNEWLILWGCFTTLGAYSIIFLNLAQICQAYGNPSASAFAVTIMMVAAACGRLGSCGFYSVALARGFPGTITFLTFNVLVLVAMLLWVLRWPANTAWQLAAHGSAVFLAALVSRCASLILRDTGNLMWLTSCGSCDSCATGTMGGLYAGLFLGALVYGGYWTLIPMVYAELWGLKNVR